MGDSRPLGPADVVHNFNIANDLKAATRPPTSKREVDVLPVQKVVRVKPPGTAPTVPALPADRLH